MHSRESSYINRYIYIHKHNYQSPNYSSHTTRHPSTNPTGYISLDTTQSESKETTYQIPSDTHKYNPIYLHVCIPYETITFKVFGIALYSCICTEIEAVSYTLQCNICT